MRIFTALELPVQAVKEVQRIQNELQREIECRKWQSLKNMHLTLHFLGEKTEADVNIVKEVMQDVCTLLPSFPLQLNGLGAFPNLKHPRVIWTGVKDMSGNMVKLQQEAARQLKEQRLYEEERSYSPHITLGREPEKGNHYCDIFEAIHIENVIWTVREAILFRSTLTPSGPIYDKLGIYSLKA